MISFPKLSFGMTVVLLVMVIVLFFFSFSLWSTSPTTATTWTAAQISQEETIYWVALLLLLFCLGTMALTFKSAWPMVKA